MCRKPMLPLRHLVLSRQCRTLQAVASLVGRMSSVLTQSLEKTKLTLLSTHSSIHRKLDLYHLEWKVWWHAMMSLIVEVDRFMCCKPNIGNLKKVISMPQQQLKCSTLVVGLLSLPLTTSVMLSILFHFCLVWCVQGSLALAPSISLSKKTFQIFQGYLIAPDIDILWQQTLVAWVLCGQQSQQENSLSLHRSLPLQYMWQFYQSSDPYRKSSPTVSVPSCFNCPLGLELRGTFSQSW